LVLHHGYKEQGQATCYNTQFQCLILFLCSQVEADGDQLLCQFIREDLLLSAEEASMIPASSKLCHTCALFEWFSCQRSIKYVASNHDPFKNIVREGITLVEKLPEPNCHLSRGDIAFSNFEITHSKLIPSNMD